MRKKPNGEVKQNSVQRASNSSLVLRRQSKAKWLLLVGNLALVPIPFSFYAQIAQLYLSKNFWQFLSPIVEMIVSSLMS